MKHVAPLRYDVIFKKAFCDPEIFMGFVRDTVGVEIEISKVETEKSFKPPVGRVASRFDLFAEDPKNRVIVDIQHVRYPDHYDAFLHYHCAAILEQYCGCFETRSFSAKFYKENSWFQTERSKVAKSENYRPKLAVYSIVVLTSGDKHQVDMAMIDFDPKTRKGKGLGEILHKVVYLCPKYADDETPPALREWLRAIDDTLDEQVDENTYQNPLVRRIFDLIEQDAVSPEERARMFEEFNQEQTKRTTFEEGKQARNIEIARSLLAKGMTFALIADVTGLSADDLIALQSE